MSEDVCKAAAELLDAVRDVPVWDGEPDEDQQDWWHRKTEGAGCDQPGCNRSPCYCDPDTDMAMQHRQRLAMLQCERAWQAYSRHSVELDAAAPEIRDLLANPWMPNANRVRAIELLRALAAGKGASAAPDALDDPKALAILRALEKPAGSLDEIAERAQSKASELWCAVSASVVRKLSKPLQKAGLMERGPNGWHRTAKGDAALGTKGT